MLQRIVPAVATALGVCAFISITMYSIYLNVVPQYTIVCTGCSPGGSCSCNATEDYCLWGMVQKNCSATLCAYIALSVLLCYAIAVIVERWLTYYYAERQTQEFTSRVAEAIYNNRLDEAKGMAAAFPKSPLAAVVNASLQHNQAIEACASGGVRPSMEARQQALVIKTAELSRGLWSLAAAGWTVPLIGLFVLVISISSGLHGWAYSEGYYPFYLIRSFADALGAAIFSIFFAIPVIWFHKCFTAKLQMRLTEMDRLSLSIISQLASPPATVKAFGLVKSYDTQPLDVSATRRLRN